MLITLMYILLLYSISMNAPNDISMERGSLSFNLIGNIHAKKLFLVIKNKLYSRDCNIHVVPYGTILDGVIGLRRGRAGSC